MTTQYPIRILTQLNPVLQGFRRSRGLTQADVAARLGVSQQSYARLEANPGRASMARVLAVLQALEVDLVLAPRGAAALADTTASPADAAGDANGRRAKPGKAGKPGTAKAIARPAGTAARRKPKPDPGSGEDW